METKDLAYIIHAHTSEAKKPEGRVRKWDRKTPYYMHPIWCATTLLHETTLQEDLRRNGSLALLYHDILEDTTAGLPGWLSEDVKFLVSEMTFESSEDEWQNLWGGDERAILLKLYDKTSTLMDGRWIKPERMAQHLQHFRKLYNHVRSKYEDLNITRLARTFLENDSGQSHQGS